MEADGSHPSNPSDPSTHRRHAAMIERLSNLHQSRLHQSVARRSSSDVASPSFDSVPSFLALFSQRKHSIESDLSRSRSLPPDSVKPELDRISASISALDRLLAENSYFLPSYEVRSSLKSISDLKDLLDTANSELLPRKKFSFKNRPSKKQSSTPPTADTTEPPTPAKNYSLGTIRDSPGFRGKESAVLVKQFVNSEEGNGEFTLADLVSCDVYLKGRRRSLFIHRLRDCRVFVGPVLGSVLIEDMESCLLMVASHQIRIHQAKATDFYVRVRSRPIVEDSSGVRFAPYRLFYEGIDEELKDSGLGEETGNWGNVDDFKWLRAVQSPNWCILPEEERVDTMDVTDLDEGCPKD